MKINKINRYILPENVYFLRLSFVTFFLFFCITAYSSESYTSTIKESFNHLEQLSAKNPYLALEAAKALLIKEEHQLSSSDKATLLTKLAQYSYFTSDNTGSMEYIERAYSLKPDLENDTGILLLLTHGVLLTSKDDSKAAMKLYDQAEKNAIKTENNKRLAETYAYIAENYSFQHNDTQALKYYHQAYILIEQLGIELEMMYLKAQMASSYSNIYDHENAIKLGKEALAYFLKQKFYFDAIYAQSGLAHSYLKLENYNDARIAFESIIELSSLATHKSAMPIAYLGLAKVYFNTEQFNQSQEYLTKFHTTRPKTMSPYTQIDYLTLEIKLALNNNDTTLAQQKVNKADNILALLENNTALSWKVKLLSVKAKLAYLKKDFESAYLFEHEAKDLHTTYQNTQREAIRSKFKILFDTDQAQLKNKILERDKLLDKAALHNAEQQKWIQYLIISFTLVVMFILISLIHKQLKTSKKLNILANTDTLTGLANRRFSLKYAEEKLLYCAQNNLDFSVITFDIDHFKTVNDTYGHPCGDIALVSIAKIANQYVREQDILARIGGEEFLLILPKTTAKKAITIAQRIRLAIENYDFLLNEQHVKITASFGVSELSKSEDSFTYILQSADSALYKAKNSGRNKVCMATPCQ